MRIPKTVTLKFNIKLDKYCERTIKRMKDLDMRFYRVSITKDGLSKDVWHISIRKAYYVTQSKELAVS